MESSKLTLNNNYYFYILLISFILVTNSSRFCFSAEKAENIVTETKRIIEIQYEEGLFSGNIENAGILEVFKKIGDIADIEFEIREGVEGIIRKEKFKNIDIRTLLERLTDSHGRGLVIYYDKEKAKKFIISKKIGKDIETSKLLTKENKGLGIKDQDIGNLIGQLSSSSSLRDRILAAEDIILLGRQIIPYLIKYLDISNDFVQQYSLIKILYTLKATEAKDVFIKLAQSDNRQLTIASLYGLARLKNHKITGPLFDIIKKTDDADMKGVAVWALGESDNAEAIPILLDELYKKQNNMKTQAIIALSLAKLNNNKGFETALKIAEQGPLDAREFAITALGNIGNRDAIPLLKKLKESEKFDSINAKIVIAIEKLSNREDDIAHLETLLKYKNKEVQLWALERLGDIGSSEAVSILEKTLHEGRITYSFDIAKEFVNLGYNVKRERMGFVIGKKIMNN